MASPSFGYQLIGDHSIHEAVTEQQNRSIAGKDVQSFGCHTGAHPRSAGGFDVA
ncbi:hypothetical protein EMIT0P291_200069 [Pseudomonas sp. IT-P291]